MRQREITLYDGNFKLRYMNDYIQYKWMDLMFQLKDCYTGFLKKSTCRSYL